MAEQLIKEFAIDVVKVNFEISGNDKDGKEKKKIISVWETKEDGEDAILNIQVERIVEKEIVVDCIQIPSPIVNELFARIKDALAFH